MEIVNFKKFISFIFKTFLNKSPIILISVFKSIMYHFPEPFCSDAVTGCVAVRTVLCEVGTVLTPWTLQTTQHLKVEINLKQKCSLSVCVCVCVCVYIYMYQEECARLREGVPYVKLYRYYPKHLCQNLNDYGDNGHRSLKL